MYEGIIIHSLIHKLILHLITLHECDVIVHITIGNKTQIDDSFIAGINEPLVVQDESPDMSYQMNEFGKVCFTSFSQMALSRLEFNYGHKRPVKILLEKTYMPMVSIPDYYPLIVEQPPVISIKQASKSSGKKTT